MNNSDAEIHITNDINAAGEIYEHVRKALQIAGLYNLDFDTIVEYIREQEEGE